MQPYFFPYEGYYKLMECVDYFVVFDNAQFPRRGRCHRLQATHVSGTHRWLTLPLSAASQEAAISEVELDVTRWGEVHQNLKMFPSVERTLSRSQALRNCVLVPQVRLLDYLLAQHRAFADVRGFSAEICLASQIAQRDGSSYAEYILEIGDRLNCEDYVNLSGGADLYSKDFFATRGKNLHFMSPYLGSRLSVLEDSF